MGKAHLKGKSYWGAYADGNPTAVWKVRRVREIIGGEKIPPRYLQLRELILNKVKDSIPGSMVGGWNTLFAGLFVELGGQFTASNVTVSLKTKLMERLVTGAGFESFL
jgi:hypothetical protein